MKKIIGWEVLFAHYLKRDWKKIIIWIISLGLFSGGLVPAFEEISKGQGLIGMYETLKNPAMISIVGVTPVQVAEDYSLGAMYAHEMLLFCGLFAMIIAALHVVAHTRKEEEQGLSELIRSFRVGRQANSVAVLVESLHIHVLLALFIGIVMISIGVEEIGAEGAFLFGFSIGLAGMIGSVLALLLSQIMATSAGATGSSLALVGLMYLLRGWTDVSIPKLTAFNPLGWTYRTFPFVENNWQFLLYGILFSGVIVILAFYLEGRRDMGTGYLPEFQGKERASHSLLSIPGLFLRLNRGVIVGWFITFIVLGVAYGSIYGDMQTFLNSNELMRQMFQQAGTSIEQSFTGTILMVMAILSAILPIAIISKLYNEEVKMRLSQLYATSISREKIYWTSMFYAIISGIIGIFLSAASLGLTAISVMTDRSILSFGDFVLSGFNFLPAVLFFTGIAAVFLGWAPRLTKWTYAYVGYSFALNYFGGIVQLPEWLLQTAIPSWISRMPSEDFNGLRFTTIMCISILLFLIGSYGYKRRDRIEGA